MLAIISWFVAIGVLTPMFDGSPMSSTGVALAMVPFIAPAIVPTGMATADIALWYVLLSVAITVVTSAPGHLAGGENLRQFGASHRGARQGTRCARAPVTEPAISSKT